MAFSRTSEQTLLAIGIVASAIAAAAIPIIISRFTPLFEAFGAELPDLTRWFVAHSNLFLLLPALVLVVWATWPVRSVRGVAAFAVGVGSLVVFVPLTVVAMYYPVMMLASVVG